MTKKKDAPLRGEAAWQASRQEMQRRTDAARDKQAADRAGHTANVDAARDRARKKAEDADRRS